MSNRERWIIYPLLLFAVVSIAIDQVGGRAFLELHTVQCQELVVASPHGAPRIVLRNDPESASGLIAIHGPAASAADIESIHRNDVQTEIGANREGGFVRIIGAEGVPTLFLGHLRQRQASGLTATDKHGILLTLDADESATTDVRQTADVWGPMLSWQEVPDSNRVFEETKAELRNLAEDSEDDTTSEAPSRGPETGEADSSDQPGQQPPD